MIGAGMAGLTCARALTEAGMRVRVFDKSRGPSGRMGTRRAGETRHFDHGAQYFTARDPAFEAEVLRWEEAGVVAPWRGRIVTLGPGEHGRSDDAVVRWVGTPRMSALGRHLARGLHVGYGVRIETVVRDDARWELADDQGQSHGTFTHVVVAVPAGQAVALLSANPLLAQQAAAVQMEPCWAVMFEAAPAWRVGFDAAFVGDWQVAWAARQSSKPGRPDADTWVVHATPSWTQQHWDDAPEIVARTLVAALATAAEHAAPAVTWSTAHRWRYARVHTPVGQPCLYDEGTGLGAAGDWCQGARVEAAFSSGRALAERMLGSR